MGGFYFAAVQLCHVEDGSSLAYFPVVHVHPDHLAHQALYLQETGWLNRGLLTKTTFYTDGSCMFPRHPTTRFAASAGTIDLCEHDEQVSCLQLSRSLHKEEHWVSKISTEPSCQQSLLFVK